MTHEQCSVKALRLRELARWIEHEELIQKADAAFFTTGRDLPHISRRSNQIVLWAICSLRPYHFGLESCVQSLAAHY